MAAPGRLAEQVQGRLRDAATAASGLDWFSTLRDPVLLSVENTNLKAGPVFSGWVRSETPLRLACLSQQRITGGVLMPDLAMWLKHTVVLWITHPSYWLTQRSNIEP